MIELQTNPSNVDKFMIAVLVLKPALGEKVYKLYSSIATRFRVSWFS